MVLAKDQIADFKTWSMKDGCVADADVQISDRLPCVGGVYLWGRMFQSAVPTSCVSIVSTHYLCTPGSDFDPLFPPFLMEGRLLFFVTALPIVSSYPDNRYPILWYHGITDPAPRFRGSPLMASYIVIHFILSLCRTKSRPVLLP